MTTSFSQLPSVPQILAIRVSIIRHLVARGNYERSLLRFRTKSGLSTCYDPHPREKANSCDEDVEYTQFVDPEEKENCYGR